MPADHITPSDTPRSASRRGLGPTALHALRAGVYLALFLTIGLAAGRLAWRPAPPAPGPPPAPCDAVTATADWADRGLRVAVVSPGPNRASVRLEPTTLLAREPEPTAAASACAPDRWLDFAGPVRDLALVSPPFARHADPAPTCVASIAPHGASPGAPALRVVYPDGAWAELDATLRRVDAPPATRLARAAAASPLGALALLALLWAAWLARAPLAHRRAATLACAAALAALAPLTAPFLEAL